MGRLRLIGMGLIAATVLAPLVGCSNAAAPAAAPGAARPAAAVASAPASPASTPAASAPAGSASAAPAAMADASRAPQEPQAAKGSAAPAAEVPQGPDTARAAAALPVEAVLTGLPESLRTGSGATEFSVVLTNRTATAYPSLAPMLVLTDGSGQALKAILERFDPESAGWKAIRVPGPGTVPIGSAGATPYTLPAHGTLTVKYRIAVPAGVPSLRAGASFYAIGADGGQIGLTDGVLPVTGA